MNRRKSIKALVLGTVSTGVLIEACDNPDQKTAGLKPPPASPPQADRMAEEIPYNKKLKEETFFNPHELATVAVLSDIIIPNDETSGSATDAEVPKFIEFMMKDRPEYQTPMRGGLKWLDMECLKQYDKPFTDCSSDQQMAMVNEIAYPKKVKPGYQPGVSFFTLLRNLTVSGFYTSEIGFKDLGYVGNRPNQWNGVPDDILKQYNMAYTEKELKECVSYES